VASDGNTTVEAEHSDAATSCHEFLDCLISGLFDDAGDQDTLWRIASIILLRNDKDQICVRQKNFQRRLYERQTSPRKQVVDTSPNNKRQAAARRQLVAACIVDVNRESYQRGGAAESGAAAGLSVKEQVGLIFEFGLGWSCFSQLRHALGGGKSGLASRHMLRSTKRELAAAPSKKVLVTSTGAQIANVALAVQERVTALCDADQFVERFVYGTDHEPLRAADAVVPDGFDPGAWGGRPPPTVPDVHVSIGLDKGGDPSS